MSTEQRKSVSMKWVLGGIIAVFITIMIATYIAAERANPVMLPEPAAFGE